MLFARLMLPVVIIFSSLAGCVNHAGDSPAATVVPEQPVRTGRETFGISEEDLRYIDLVVPEYAEIVLYHEDAPGTVAFAKQLIAWFRANHASIELHQVKKITDREPPDTRNFSIDFIGDHRYVVRLFNKTGE